MGVAGAWGDTERRSVTAMGRTEPTFAPSMPQFDVRSARLPVPVVDPLDLEPRLDPAQRDLARAWVVDDVVGLARAEGEQRQPVVAGAERMRDAGSGRAGDDAAGLGPGAARRRAAASRRRRARRRSPPRRSGSAADCSACPARRRADRRRSGPSRARRRGRAAGCATSPWRASLSSPSASATIVGGRPGSGAGSSSGPAATSRANGSGPSSGSQCGLSHIAPGARQPGRAGVRAAAVGEHVEPVARAGDRVRLGSRQVQDAVARADRRTCGRPAS